MTDIMGTAGDTGWVDPVIPDSAWEGADDGADVAAEPDGDLDESDTGADELGGEEPDAPEPPAEPEPPAAAEKPAEEVFDRAFVEKLRNENAQARVESNTFKQAFEGYDPASQQAILEFARNLIENPAAAAAQAEAIAQNIRAQPQWQPDDQPLTAAQVQQMFAERDQRAQQDMARQQEQRLATEVFSKIQGFGLEPQSYEAQSLILSAMINHKNDLDVALQARQAERDEADKAAVQRYLASKRAKAASSPRPTTGSTASPGSQGNQIHTIADAQRAAMASLDAGI